jgi:polyhydroxyalkanoate synthesis regulator phasin
MGRVSMPQGKGSQLHNRRGYESIGRDIPEHIDQKRTHENVTLVDIPIKQAYDELFGEALAAYNAKQRRSDRKIASYYDHVKGLKTGEKLFYEDVVQWGSKDDFTDEKTRQNAKECLIEYVKGFQERNPNLKLIGAYIHMDEASPHLHLDYIPHAHGYKRGLSVRNSFSRALHEMGFEQDPETRKDNAAVQWKKHERAVFGDICAAHGLEVEEERAARGSLSVDEYKEARDKMLEPIKQEMQVYQQKELETLQVEKKALQSEISGLRGIIEALREKIAVLKDTAAAKLLRVQKRLDRTLSHMPEKSSQDFKREWAKTKEITIEQAVKPKQKGWER